MSTTSVSRIIPTTKQNFFLFGPRGTGKSTWLKKQLNPDLTVDLLSSKTFQQYSLNLNLLREIVDANKKYKIIVIDEIQKLPALLDEVHSLIFDKEDEIQFILTGSSSRKLRRGGVNLLAGRAVIRNFHQFSMMELKSKFNIDKALEFGLMPKIWNLETDEEKKDYLYSYVDTYMKEEIQQEAAVRNISSYQKFLEHFAIRNGQVINISRLAGEIGIPRTSINGYLEILEETLLGFRIAPIHLKAKAKEVSTPKFYFFDPGVVRVLSGNIENSMDLIKGSLFETYILHEIKTYSDYFLKRLEVYYWGTPSESEVDFILCKGSAKIGVEVKSSKRWGKDFNRGLEILVQSKKINKAYGVYLGKEKLVVGNVNVYPVKDFVTALFKGELI